MSEPDRGTALQKHLKSKARQEKRELSGRRETSTVKRSVAGSGSGIAWAISIIGLVVVIFSVSLFGKFGDGNTNWGDFLGLIGGALGASIMILGLVVWGVVALFRAIWRGIRG